MKKYKVTQEFMDSLNEWRDRWEHGDISIFTYSFDEPMSAIDSWRFMCSSTDEQNKRFGALVNWINGEDVFEVGKPKYIVQRNEIKSRAGREYLHITADENIRIIYDKDNATKFDDFEKAFEWTNAHFEVVEVDE